MVALTRQPLPSALAVPLPACITEPATRPQVSAPGLAQNDRHFIALKGAGPIFESKQLRSVADQHVLLGH